MKTAGETAHRMNVRIDMKPVAERAGHHAFPIDDGFGRCDS